jgi:hypothetical protein
MNEKIDTETYVIRQLQIIRTTKQNDRSKIIHARKK